jgi:hypothetical protein
MSKTGEFIAGLSIVLVWPVVGRAQQAATQVEALGLTFPLTLVGRAER